MLLFFCGVILLVAGYFSYGWFIERVVRPSSAVTPARQSADGVDFVEMPTWKNMLIHLLNIAGVGPVIGVILGIKFGSIVFILIPVGNILGGAVHDFLLGMMSLRHGGANLPRIVRTYLGVGYGRVFSVFMVLLLLLVVAVFVNVPANLIDGFFVGHWDFWAAAGLIFFYYISATLFPVDKIIGRFYPIFGAVLLAGTAAIAVAVAWRVWGTPEILTETEAFRAGAFTPEFEPIIPMLFVTIACGILSGFHATQAPIIARTLKTEHHAKPVFYGMMIVEGLIAMVWAAAGMAIYNLFPAMMNQPPALVLGKICETFLGKEAGMLTILAVVLLAVTSGDTAMRSLRMSLAEIFSVPQGKAHERLLLCVPIILAVVGLFAWSNMNAQTFNVLWNYFAWGNQVLAVSSLLAAAVWLRHHGKMAFPALVPAAFMLFVVFTYILWISPAHSRAGNAPLGFGLPLDIAYGIAAVLTVAVLYRVWRLGSRMRN